MVLSWGDVFHFMKINQAALEEWFVEGEGCKYGEYSAEERVQQTRGTMVVVCSVQVVAMDMERSCRV